jgi:hypothetical protein
MSVFRSYIIAALRNLARNKLYAAINITGLAIGFAAAIFIALFVRDELSFDRFWPEYQRLYMVSMELRLPGVAPWALDAAPGNIPALLRPKLPADVLIARLMDEQHTLRRGDVEANEEINWVDPDFFSIFRMQTIAGNPDEGVRRADGVVLTQTVAHKYFGNSNPVGQILELDRQHPLRVAAVIKDVPGNSHLQGGVFASGLAAFSGLSMFDKTKAGHSDAGIGAEIAVYLQLPPGAAGGCQGFSAVAGQFGSRLQAALHAGQRNSSESWKRHEATRQQAAIVRSQPGWPVDHCGGGCQFRDSDDGPGWPAGS